MRARVLIGATMVFGLVATATSPSLHDDAQRRLRAKRFVEGRARHHRLTEPLPHRAGTTVWTGRPAGWLHDAESAEAALDAALSVDAGDVDALLGKAYLLAWQDRNDEIEPLLAQACDLAPDRADVRLACERQAAIAVSGRRAGVHPLARLMRVLIGRS